MLIPSTTSFILAPASYSLGMVTEKRSGGASFARGVGFEEAAYDEKSFVATASSLILVAVLLYPVPV